jgi:hypothetical protein
LSEFIDIIFMECKFQLEFLFLKCDLSQSSLLFQIKALSATKWDGV